jgi:signal transduction histidine kinase
MKSRQFSMKARAGAAVSVGIFLAMTGLMAYLRLHLFADRFVSLTYGLPLLICLWHRDKALLWAMSLAFTLMATYKAFFLLPDPDANDHAEALQWLMQVINVVVIAAVVHAVVRLTERLDAKNAELEEANADLARDAERISRQNVELQAQAEELAQQNEEIQSQSEELSRQNEEAQQQSEELHTQSEELQAQTEELQALNNELGQRESMLRTLLESLRITGGDRPVLQRICQAMLDLFQGSATAAAVLERSGEELVLRAQSGVVELRQERWPFDRSFASIIMAQNRTGFVDDLAERPDLVVPEGDRKFRSILASPFQLNGRAAGAVEVYAELPRKWTREQFRIIEWVAAQCSLVLELRRLQDELERSNLRLEEIVQERTAKLQELVGELEHFSYSITHDMRAPLRAMQGFAEMLAEECGQSLQGESAEYLRRIQTAAHRMDRLITDCLSYSRAVQESLRLAPVDPAQLLRDIVASYPHLQPPLAEVTIEPNLPPVLANEAGLTQCFSNLLSNAVKFVEPNCRPQIRIWAAENNDGVVRLWIEDNGIGIAPEMQPRIFGMFQRASKAYDGTGIGLALVRKVAQRMGGKVGVESTPGKGSRFWLELRAVKT